jgi:hypothetical protein
MRTMRAWGTTDSAMSHDGEGVRPGTLRPGASPRVAARRARPTVLLALSVAALGCRPPAPAAPATPAPPPIAGGHAVDEHGPFFYHGRDYGTDAYAGPLDIFFNKGYAVAQWEGKGRDIFDYPYGWGAVRGALIHPFDLIRRAGGLNEVLLEQAVPFARGGVNDSQWVPNYFGHILEGGIAYRRLREWNEAHGVPLPGLTAAIINLGSAVVNEAYETPVGDTWASQHGTAGSVVDLWLFDPVGILLFQQDGVARFFARRLHGALWPSQASLTVTDHLLMNNGESIVLKPPIPFTDRARFFVRAGMGIEAGLSVPRADGLTLDVGVGQQSRQRWLDPYTALEFAEFGWSAGVWLDRDDTLLAGLTWERGTDRRVSLNVYPGFARVAGTELGAWFVLDAAGRPYLGISTSRTLGAGLGIGF